MTPNIDTAERMKVIGARMRQGMDTYAGRLDAWHSMGEVTGEFSTWRELLVAAKAEFLVVKRQLEWKGKLVESYGTFRVDQAIPKGLQDHVIPVVSADGKSMFLTFLGNVGKDYQVIQHTEGFELLDSLVGSINGAHYETMGTLDFGRTVWGQVDPNIKIRVGDDESEIYLMFQTSHDGSKATEVFETGVRAVCRNTFRLANLKKLSSSLRVKHTKNAQKKMDSWKTELEEIRDVAMGMEEKLNFLNSRKVTKESLGKVMDRLFPKKKTEDGDETSSTRRDNILVDILKLYEDNDGNQFPEQRGTAYNLFNSITNYVDHSRSTHGDRRAESAVFGSGATLKGNALEMIMQEAEGMPTFARFSEAQKEQSRNEVETLLLGRN